MEERRGEEGAWRKGEEWRRRGRKGKGAWRRREERRGEEEDVGNWECNKSRKSAVCSVLCWNFVVVGRTLYNLEDFTFNSLLLKKPKRRRNMRPVL